METQTHIDESVENGFTSKKSEYLDETSVPLEDLPSVRLSPRQGKEIHMDEYSLKLFYATRISPMTLDEIIQRFPEPSPGKAQSVLDKYLDCDLIHRTSDGAYYSNYPDGYINYSDHRYDEAFEVRKNAKIFKLMKNHSGDKEYWKTRSYFSIDSFFTENQTKELQAMFTEVRYKAKQFVQKNARNKTFDGLKFRRLKFYDMILSVLFFVLVGTMPTQKALAGNDPTQPYNFGHFTHNAKNIISNDFAGNVKTDDTFNVAMLEPLLKEHLEMGDQTGEFDPENPILMTLVKECREYLIAGESGPSTLDQDCMELLNRVIDECLNENDSVCQELKSENLTLET